MGERTNEIRTPSDPDVDVRLAGQRVSATAGGKSSDEIAAEIDQTRTEMSETVDALQKKLAPDRIVDDFLDTARDSVDRNLERILDTMRRHPIVTSLTGLGVGWLLLQSTARRDFAAGSYSTYGDYDEFTDEGCSSAGEPVGDTTARFKETMSAGTAAAREKVSQLASGAREKTAHLAGRAREQAAHVTAEAAGYAREQAGYVANRAREQAGYVAGRARDRAGDVANRARERAGYLAGRARDRAGDVAGRAREQMSSIGTATAGQARHAAHRVGDMVYENPFAAAAIGVAVGAALGFLIPETRKEDEFMGEARDNLLDKAKATASDTMERVQRVAEAAKDAAMEEADKQNLNAENLARQAGVAADFGKSLVKKVEDTVKSAAGAAREEARRQAPSESTQTKTGSAVEAGKGFTPSESSGKAADDMRREGCGD